MPVYKFEVEGDDADEQELRDDDAAWSAIVTWCGELLKDMDGKLPSHTHLVLSVAEGTRQIAQIRIIADRTS